MPKDEFQEDEPRSRVQREWLEGAYNSDQLWDVFDEDERFRELAEAMESDE